jgi:hypothetical protein
MRECNQNTLGDSKSSKYLLFQWESVAATSCSKTLKSKWDEMQDGKSKRVEQNFSRVTLAQRLVKK